MAAVQLPAIPATVSAFASLCEQIGADTSTTVKTEVIAGFVARYTGDLALLFRLLLPRQAGRLYQLQDKQLLKLLAAVLGTPEASLKAHLQQSGCIAATAVKFFKAAVTADPNMTLATLDTHLDALAAAAAPGAGGEAAQLGVLRGLHAVATPSSLFAFLRQVKQDLRLGAGLRVVLSGLHPSANDIFKHCASIPEVVRRIAAGDTALSPSPAGAGRSPSPGRVKAGKVEAAVVLGLPVQPQLAAPNKSCAQVIAKCPNGAYSETKYDGERIQIHKQGDKFHFFARSLKPVKPDKYEGLEKYIAAAVKATDCVLDGEILLVDTTTSQPLPFGTLGKHKKAQFTTANTAIFLFDILFKDGVTLFARPLKERRELLQECVSFIPNRILLSEMRHIHGTVAQQTALLQAHLNHAMATKLEGLVVKDVLSPYNPGSRHWIKLKKDYLDGCGDTADLVPIGAWYGQGARGGLLSTFLMGVRSGAPRGSAREWKTMTKVSNGWDDAALAALQAPFKALTTASTGQPPAWLHLSSNALLPDVVAKDPAAMPVWEVMLTEFSTSTLHTAAISCRFPRIVRERPDKDTATATTLEELRALAEMAKTSAGKAALPADDAFEEVDPDAPPPAAVAAPPAPTPPAQAVTHAAAAQPAGLPQGASPGPRPQAGAALARAGTITTGGAEANGYELRRAQQDIAQPLSLPLAASEQWPNMVVFHSVAEQGRWSHRGVMGAISKVHGAEVKEAYEDASASCKLGDVVLVEVSNRFTKGKLWIASAIAQRQAPKGQAPVSDKEAISASLRKVLDFAVKQRCSVHVAIPDTSARCDWHAAEDLIVAIARPAGMHVTLYTRDGFGRSGSVLGSPPPAPAPAAPAPAAPASIAATPAVPAPTGFAHIGSAPAAPQPTTAAAASSAPKLPLHGVVAAVMPSSPAALMPMPSKARSAATSAQDTLVSLGAVMATPPFLAPDAAVAPPGTTHVVVLGAAPKHWAQPAVTLAGPAWLGACRAEARRLPGAGFPPGAPSASPPRATGAASPASTAPMPSLPESLPSTASLVATGSGSGVFGALAGLSVALHGFGAQETAELTSRLGIMGAAVIPQWNGSAFLVAHAPDATTQRVLDLGGTPVGRRWVDACFATGTKASPAKYVLDTAAPLAPTPPPTPPPPPVLAQVPAAPPAVAPAAPVAAPTRVKRARTPDLGTERRAYDAANAAAQGAAPREDGPLGNAVVALAGYGPVDAAALEHAVAALGGAVRPAGATSWAGVTHLLSDTFNAGYDAAKLQRPSLPVLRRCWLDECLAARRLVDVLPRHQFPVPPGAGTRRQVRCEEVAIASKTGQSSPKKIAAAVVAAEASPPLPPTPPAAAAHPAAAVPADDDDATLSYHGSSRATSLASTIPEK